MSISQEVSIIRSILASQPNKHVPPDTTMINGYMFYVALSSSKYQFNCVQCGHYPPILIFDLCKNTVFNIAGQLLLVVFIDHYDAV